MLLMYRRQSKERPALVLGLRLESVLQLAWL
jgi:hypothetical protein